MRDLTALTQEDIDEYAGWAAQPWGLRTIMDVHRESEKLAEVSKVPISNGLEIPILGIGGDFDFCNGSEGADGEGWLFILGINCARTARRAGESVFGGFRRIELVDILCWLLVSPHKQIHRATSCQQF